MSKKYLAGVLAAALVFVNVQSTSYALESVEAASVSTVEQDEQEVAILESNDLEQADPTEAEESGETVDENIAANEAGTEESVESLDNQPGESMDQAETREESAEQYGGEDIPVEQPKGEEVPVEQPKGGEVSVEQPKGEEVPVEQPKGEEASVEQSKGGEAPAEQPKSDNVSAEQPENEDISAEPSTGEEASAELSIDEEELDQDGISTGLAPEDNIAHGKNGDIEWNISADGKLTVSGTGDYSDPGASNVPLNERIPWYEYRTSIFSAEVNVTGMTNAAGMFNGCSSLISVDLSHFDTGNVTDMGGMFFGCAYLEELDLSNFDTGNVIYMTGMFSGCSKLTSLNLSNFDTGNVTNMERMFYGCSNLSSLDVGNFNTENVTSMGGMFSGCSNLTSLDLSQFDTGNVTNMGGMFYDCSNLANLDVSHFDTGNVTTMRGMFSGCSNLASLDVSSFDTGNVTDMAYMFERSGVTSLDLSHFNTGSVTTMEYMFGLCNRLVSLDVSNFDTQNVTTMRLMFVGCRMPSLDLSGFATTKVQDMTGMFSSCINLASLDLSSFTSESLREMTFTFANCKNLTEINMSGFDMSKVGCGELFPECILLQKLYTPQAMGDKTIALPAQFSDPEGNQTMELTDAFANTILTRAESGQPGTQVGSVDGTNGMITWIYDTAVKTAVVTGKGTRTGAVFQDSCFPQETEHIQFEDCEIEGSLAGLFRHLANLSSIDFTGLQATNIIDMSCMFEGCSNLDNLDMSKFDTSNVTDMKSMFMGCMGLTNLDLSHFDTGNVTDMSYMFHACSGLTSLDVSNFDTGNVTTMKDMFDGCERLSSLDLSHFDTGNVTNMRGMFCACSSLNSLDLSSFDTGNVTNMEQMFSSCSSLRELNLSNFDISKVADIRGFLRKCNLLQILHTPRATGDVAVSLPAIFSDTDGNQTESLTADFTGTILKKVDESMVSSNYSEVLDALQTEEIKKVSYILDEGQEISQTEQEEIFIRLQNSDKSLSFTFKNASGEEIYRWIFQGSEIMNPKEAIDFGIVVDANDPDVLAAVPDGSQQVDLKFSHEGNLPGTAYVQVFIGEGFDGKKLRLYYYNPDKKVLELADTKVEYNGRIASFELNHCSSYLLMEADANSSISGSVTSFDNQETETHLQLMDKEGKIVAETAVTGNTGEYQLMSVEAGTYTLQVSKANHVTREYPVTVEGGEVTLDVEIRLPGDVDGNGRVNAKDKRMIYNHIANITILTGYEFKVGDIDGNGSVNAKDKRMVYNHIAGVKLLW